MATALIALGSNLGDRQRILDDAVAQLSRESNVVVLATSRWHATRPVGGSAGQTEFLNGAALLGTSLTAHQLHAVLSRIESAAGRTREERWGPRTLDIDLLLYEDLVIDTPELMLPHPRMSFRRFVLEPAAEIAPSMRHPTIGWTIGELRDHIRARGPYVVAIAGPHAAAKRELASAVAASVGGRVIADPIAVEFTAESPAMSPDVMLQREIEWLESRAKSIYMTAWASSAFMAISDYWIGESLCHASMMVLMMKPVDLFVEYSKRYCDISAAVTRPKLLALLDMPPPEPSWHGTAVHGWESSRLSPDWQFAKFQNILHALIAEPGNGPLLRLDGTKLSEAHDELSAAIQSMS